MTIGIKLGQITDEIGSSDFFHSFFSTIAGNLEPEGWGSRFPTMMNTFYAGKLESWKSMMSRQRSSSWTR